VIVRSVDELLGRRVSMRALALLRVFMGPIVLLHLRPFLADALHGHIYRDAFYESYASWYPELPRGVYVALLWLGAVAAVAMSLGILTRVATATTFGVVAYNLFLSTTHFHNNRAYLVIVLGVLALAPCGRELSLDAWIRRRRGRPPLDLRAPGWPLWLLRFECSAVYAASGMSKLLDPDWFGGTVPWMRVVESRADLRWLPHWAVSILTNRDFHTVAAKFVIGTELFIAAGLWSRRTRSAAVWVAVIFHLTIQASAAIEIFSVLGIAVLVVWATPSTRDRVLRVDPKWHRLVARLDWLARFRTEPATRLQVTDRDGEERTGAAAAAFAFSRFPLTAWLALPLTLRPRRSPRGCPPPPGP
jgi:hypothetical protein